MVAWPASQPALGGSGGRLSGPLAPPKLARWPSHHACGLPTMYGFPTMYLGSPPCISINGIRYPVSGIRFNAYALRIARFTHCLLYALPLYALPALRLKLEVEGVWNSPDNREGQDQSDVYISEMIKSGPPAASDSMAFLRRSLKKFEAFAQKSRTGVQYSTIDKRG